MIQLKEQNAIINQNDIDFIISNLDFIGTDDIEIHQFTTRLKSIMKKFPNAIIQELIQIFQNNDPKTIRVCLHNYPESKTIQYGNVTGWCHRNRNIMCAQTDLLLYDNVIKSNDDELAGVLFHELCHLIIHISKPNLTFELNDDRFSENECYYLGGLFMKSETLAYIDLFERHQLMKEEEINDIKKIISLI